MSIIIITLGYYLVQSLLNKLRHSLCVGFNFYPKLTVDFEKEKEDCSFLQSSLNLEDFSSEFGKEHEFDTKCTR